MQTAGHSGTAVGLLWSLGVAAEILLFMVAPNLPAYHKIHPPWLLAIGGGAGVLRWGAMALNPPLPILLALQGMASAIIHPLFEFWTKETINLLCY